MRLFLFSALLLFGACQADTQCRPGERDCVCAQGSCGRGSVCLANRCVSESLGDLNVGSAAARGCEVLLRETGGKIARVDFQPDVTGKWLRQGDKVSAAFIANQDDAIAGGAVRVAYAGGERSFEVLRSHCYGTQGEELAGVEVRR